MKPLAVHGMLLGMAETDQNKQTDDLMRLIDISRQMAVTIELEPLLKSIEQAALQILDCERVSIFLYDRNRDELFSKIATGVDVIRFPANKGIAGEAAQTRKTINVTDAYSDPRFNPAVDRITGFKTRNLLTLSMVGYDGELIGVLQLLNKKHASFTPGDERLAETLSALAGVAIQRQFLLEAQADKKKLERDLDLARQIQQGYLPAKDPDVPGFDIAGWNQPAEQTGGDAYDFIPTAHGQVGLLIADATGHGIGPALMVAECRAMLRVLAYTTEDLQTIMTQTNGVLYEDLREGRFVTVCLAVLDPARGHLTYLSAGHGPLIHYMARENRFIDLPATTIPMGIMPNLPCGPPYTITLEPGDLFVLTTDGFVEWSRNDGEQFGLDRMHEVIRCNRQRSCREIIEALHRSVLEFAEDSPQQDDLTAIFIKKT